MAPNKDLQATLELINNYKHTAEQKKGTNQGVSLTPVNKGKVPWQSRYYYDISKRMYAEPELFIVFKDTNCTEGNRLLCFSQRLWIYATGNFVRLMNSTSLRSVFRQHTNSVTDIHIIENNPSHHFLLCTADKNGTVCIWSISQKTNAAPVGLPHYIHNFNHRVVKVESMLNPHSKSAFFLFVVLETSGVHIFEFPRSMSRNEIDGAELGESSSIALPFPPTGAHVISQSSSGACALHLNKILLLSQGALLRAFLLPDVRSQNVWKSLYEVQVETRDPRTAQSRTDSITFLHSLNATTCLIATLTSLQIRKIPSSVELSAHDSKNLGKLIHTLFLDDLSHYTIQLHSLKEKQFAVVACSTQLEPLLCVHIGPMMPETNADEETTFCFTHVSEYELLSGVHSFQIVNGREPNTIGVYLMHANYIVQMILQSPHGVTPQRVQSIENSEMNAERFIEQSQGANVRNQLISKNDQRIQVVEGTSVTRKSTDSEKSDEKIAKLMENFMIQKQQIQSLTEIIEMQSKIVNEMSQKAEGALGEKSGDRHAVGKDKRSVHTAQDDALASLEKRVLQLRKQIQDFEQSENHKVRLLMDEFIRVLSHRVPNLINDALSKVIQKEINKSRTSQTNVAKDVLSTCQSSIEKLLCDVQSEVATHFDKQNNTMIEEILDWKGTLLSELDRVYAELSALSTLRRSEWGE